MKFIKQAIRFLKQLKWPIKLALVVAFLAVLALIPVEVTGRTEFCNNCHIMDEYYTSWQEGSHSQVNCLKCHLQPGFSGYIRGKLNGLAQAVDCAVGRVGTKPNASVMDISCLRSGCHDVETLKAQTVNFNGVQFSHAKHIQKTVDGITLQCATCHSHFEGREHFTVNKDVCFTCHFLEGPNGKGRVVETGCRSCHEVPTEVIQRGLVTIDHQEFVSYNASCEQSCHKNEIQQPSHVDDTVCLDCHSFRLERPVDSTELHAYHHASSKESNEKVECFACHGEITHARTNVASVDVMMECTSCHSNTHQVQQSLYSTAHTIPTGTPNRVLSPMFLTHVECTGCHIKREAKTSGALDSLGTVARAVPEACDRCHAPGTGQQFIPFWQGQIKNLHARLSERVSQLEQRLAGSSSLQTGVEDAQQRIDRVKAVLNSVTADGSWGVHNFKYTEKLLLDADTDLSELNGKL